MEEEENCVWSFIEKFYIFICQGRLLINSNRCLHQKLTSFHHCDSSPILLFYFQNLSWDARYKSAINFIICYHKRKFHDLFFETESLCQPSDMHSILIFILGCLAAVSDCLEDYDHEIVTGDSALQTTTHKRPVTIPPPSFLELPENIIIEYEDASSYVNDQNHNIEHVMGVADDRCDNARVIMELSCFAALPRGSFTHSLN